MPAFLKQTFAGGSLEAKTRDKVLERLHLSMERYGGQSQKFRDLSRQYLGLTPTLRGPDNDRPTSSRKNRYPDLVVRRAFTSIQAAIPPWAFSVVGGNPPVRVFGRKQEQKGKAESVQKMTAYDWERSEVLLRTVEGCPQLFKYGTMIGYVGYKYDSYMLKRRSDVTRFAGFKPGALEGFPPPRFEDGTFDFEGYMGKFQKRMQKHLITKSNRVVDEEEIVRFDGPWLENVSDFNFHPDPYYPRIPEMRFAIRRRWADRATLKLENENHERLTGEAKYKNLDKIPRMKSGYVESIYQMDMGDDIAEAMGWTNAYALNFNKYAATHGSYKIEDDLVQLIEYWDRDDRLVILANDETPIHDGENPFDDKELPFVAARCYVLDGQFWGMGYLHPNQRSQKALDAHLNLIYRQGQLNILNVWGYDQHIGIDPNIDLEPGSINAIPMHADGNPGIVQLYKGQPLPAEAYKLFEILDNDMQMANAQPMYMAGPTDANSATEANIGQQNVQSRVRMQSLHGELTWATEIARKFHSRRQQFLKDDGETFRILGADAVTYERMTPQDIAGEYDFVAAGQHIHATPDVLRTQMSQQIAIIGQNPTFLAIHNVYEMFAEWWKLAGFPRPEVFLNKPRENTVSPKAENLVLTHGEWIMVNPNDNHEAHKQIHMADLGSPGAPNADEMRMAHIAEHDRNIEMMVTAQPPAQEQPGMKGAGGQVGNLENAVPSQGSLMASVGGAAT